jgi:hypothetical protein
MMVMYALEHRHAGFVLAFACGCALSSAYGFLAGTWPFGVVEAIWAVIAIRRYRTHRDGVVPASRGEAPRERAGNSRHGDDCEGDAGIGVHAARHSDEGG